jgi:NAD(P)-dependent dehydrogenase (short-subunit alcohol dehydrogenase family)
LKEKIILITGSTDGIGKQSAIELAKQGEHVIIHGRNQEKVNKTLSQIKEETKNDKIDGVYAELGSFKDIKEMTKNLYKQFDHINVLINNAGVFRSERHLSQEGLEETFAINYVAPFLLTNLLIDLLKKSNSARIVDVVSRVHSNHLDINDLQNKNDYTGTKAYALSKTCLIMFTYLLAEKLKYSNITVNCLHPGIINTKLLKEAMGLAGDPPSKGAEAIIYVATASVLENMTGRYFMNNTLETSKPITYHKDLQKKLWQKTEELLEMKFENF